MANDIDIIGFDKVLVYLQDYNNCNQIILKRATNQLYITPEDINTNQRAVEHFKSFVENHILSEHNGNNFTIYKLQLNNVNKAKKVVQLTNPNIQFNATPQSQFAPKPMGNIDNNGFTNKEFIQLATENAILKSKCDNLEQEVDELQSLVIELEAQIAETEPQEKQKGIGDVVSDVLVKNADGIIMMLASKMFGSSPQGNPIGMAGIETPEQLLGQMLLIEPDFTEHLKMLIQLRKHKPDIYTMAVNQMQTLL